MWRTVGAALGVGDRLMRGWAGWSTKEDEADLCHDFSPAAKYFWLALRSHVTKLRNRTRLLPSVS
jgi:hypothetical protein